MIWCHLKNRNFNQVPKWYRHGFSSVSLFYFLLIRKFQHRIYYFKIWLVKLWVWICILTVTIGTRKKIQGQFIIFSLFPLWIKRRSSRINSTEDDSLPKSKSKGACKVSKQSHWQRLGNMFSNKLFSIQFEPLESKIVFLR